MEPRVRVRRMRSLFGTLVVLVGGLAGCGGSGGPDTHQMTYGSPPAVVSFNAPRESTYYAGAALGLAPEVKPAPDAAVTDVRLDVTHRLVRLNDSTEYVAWTFGGVVPGPIIHVRQGTRVRLTLNNRSDESVAVAPPMPHSIDLHAAMVAPSDKYQTIAPGATIKFEWVANYPGVFMYHCATPPMLHHIAAGMFGMVIVDPRGGYGTRPDREYAIVQSELYLAKGRGRAYEIDDAAAREKRPTYVVFNGTPTRHVDEPLDARPGERVRLYLLNAGPNGTSSFHVLGTILDRVWLDGDPANELRGMQTVLLGASSGAVVEFVIPEAGVYTFVDHEFADAERGATGHINALGGGR